ncbi:MAG: hypothetical protein ACRDJ9_23040 [Dehalococcoidia bacterium]
MTTDQIDTLIIKDQSGNYFLMPEELLKQGRVPEQHTAEVEQIVNDADVSGHFHAQYVLYRVVRSAIEGAPLRGVIDRFLEQNR